MKKQLFQLFAVLCMAFAFASCNPSARSLVGTWAGVNGDGASVTLTFKTHNVFSAYVYLSKGSSTKSQTVEGTYSCTESTFVLHIKSINKMEHNIDYPSRYVMATDGKSMQVIDVYGKTIGMLKY